MTSHISVNQNTNSMRNGIVVFSKMFFLRVGQRDHNTARRLAVAFSNAWLPTFVASHSQILSHSIRLGLSSRLVLEYIR